MKLLIILGWIVVPYIMIFIQWRKVGLTVKIFGVAWAVLTLLVTIGSFLPSKPLTAEEIASNKVQAAKLQKIKDDGKARIADAQAALDKQKAAADAAKAQSDLDAKTPVSVDFKIFEAQYKAETDLQKDDQWKSIKGRLVQWRGTVIDVKKTYVDVKVLDSTFTYDFKANVADDQKDKMININKGDIIFMQGTLADREGLILPWVLDDAIILK